MISFVLKVSELFSMNSGLGDNSNFKANKHRLVIPVYQREYKWEDERINSLLSDIEQNSKFIGNIILDEADNKYEIVDGQQRLTTCFLAFVALFNHYSGHQIEQEMIKRYLTPFDTILLENDSIGNYLVLSEGKYYLCITGTSDIYGQEDDFSRAYQQIEKFIYSLGDNSRIIQFKNKLLDSKLLVLINDQHDTSHPVEQLFLDINEKAQLLKLEDIFKGHCFEKFDAPYYPILRNKWAEIKKNANKFKRFGFEDTSEYIYAFLLETDNSSLPKNLKKSGKHYIEDKTMDETDSLLDEMIAFGSRVNHFYDNLKSTDYRFEDICNNSHEHRNTPDHLGLKQMCLAMLEQAGANYQKLPFMYFIQYVLGSDSIQNTLQHSDLKRIITNLYIYTSLFILSGNKKSKACIDQSVRDALNSDSQIPNTIGAAKKLRNEFLERFVINNSYSFEKMSFLYSVIDNYSSNCNWLNLIYAIENHHNLEHFIIPQKNKGVIRWENGNSSFNIEPDYNLVKLYRNHLVNHLIMDVDLNGNLKNFDIVYKIKRIKEWYSTPNATMPKHIESVIEFIEGMPEYVALKEAKEHNDNVDIIKNKYRAFISAYFDSEKVETNKKRITELFLGSFQN